MMWYDSSMVRTCSVVTVLLVAMTSFQLMLTVGACCALENTAENTTMRSSILVDL